MLDIQNKININVINEAIIAFAFDDVATYTLHEVSTTIVIKGIPKC